MKIKAGIFAYFIAIPICTCLAAPALAQCNATLSSTVTNILNASGPNTVYEESWSLNWKTWVSDPTVVINSGSSSESGYGYQGYVYYEINKNSCSIAHTCLSTSKPEPDKLPTVSHSVISSDASSITFEFIIASWQYIPGDLCSDDPTHNNQGSAQEVDENYQFTESC